LKYGPQITQINADEMRDIFQSFKVVESNLMQALGIFVVEIGRMTDMTQKVFDSKPEPLAALLAAIWSEPAEETSTRKASLLADLLNRPWVEKHALGPPAQSAKEVSLESSPEADPMPPVLAEVLFAQHTPIDSLRALKQEFKRRRMLSGDPSEAAVNSAVYYTSVAAALVYQGIRISELTAEALNQAFAWMLGQPWMDPRCRTLANQAANLTSIGTGVTDRHS
jgi:hypothetical protein